MPGSNGAIEEIIRFQVERGLDQKEYDPVNEHASIVEELFESVGLDVPKENRIKLKERWIEFTSGVAMDEIAVRVGDFNKMLDDEKVDAYADIVVFAIGSIMKLGYHPTKVLEEVGKEINSRAGVMVDGKFEKDLSDKAKANWYKADYSTCKGA